MPAYKDNKHGSWYVKCTYQTYEGTRKQKMKRGFNLQRDALKWESEFLKSVSGSPEMLFSSLVERYKDEKRRTLKPSTVRSRFNQIEHHILPYFKDKTLISITDKDVRQWQFDVMENVSDSTGNPLSASTRRTIFKILTNIFSFAMRECGLPVNPCSQCGNLNERPEKHMDFWTQEEFNRFIATFEASDSAYVMFMTLYYTGIRIGELLALTPADVDIKRKTIAINKTLAQTKDGMVIQSPKTASSSRVITIPQFLGDIITQYESHIYDLQPDDRLFQYNRWKLDSSMKKHSVRAGLKPIRIHDLRHSHASLLINLGYSPVEVANRLGHEKPSITLDIYSHMYASKQDEIASKLQEIFVAS